MNILSSNSSNPSLIEKFTLNFIQLFPIRKGKERIVDDVGKFLSFPEGSICQAAIDNNVSILVDVFERIQSYICFIGEFERHETKKFIDSISPGNVVIDLGGNIGYFSLIASKYFGKKGNVFFRLEHLQKFMSLFVKVIL
jgi:hypothetical protein